ELQTDLPNPEVIAEILKMTSDLASDRPPTDALVESVLKRGRRSPLVLQRQAQRLEKTALRLRQLAAAVQLKSVQQELMAVLNHKEADIDLLRAALLVARIDNPELEIDTYVAEVGRIVEEIRAKLPDKVDDRKRLQVVDEHLFQNLGFHGSRTRYYHRSNSYLNEVIDDREGLPISLSVLYIAIAAQLDVQVVGVGLPGHFVVRCEPDQGDAFLVDVYNGGKRMSRQEAEQRAADNTQAPFRKEFLAPQAKQAIVIRMLRNLQGVAIRAEDRDALLRYVDTMVLLDSEAGEHRWMRAVLYLQVDRIAESIQDTEWILEHQPADVDRTRVLELRRHLQTLK
ncbi:MAG: transglutaminase-like domain-containing protein, partial [Planctomycetaceae bacterium]